MLLSPTVAYAELDLDRIFFAGLEGGVVGGALGLVGGLIWGLTILYKKVKFAAKKRSAKLKPKVQAFKTKSSAAISRRVKTSEQKILDIDDKFFKSAVHEIQQNTQTEGLWIKCLAIAEGSEEKQKAHYIRLRAVQLSEAAELQMTKAAEPHEESEAKKDGYPTGSKGLWKHSALGIFARAIVIWIGGLAVMVLILMAIDASW